MSVWIYVCAWPYFELLFFFGNVFFFATSKRKYWCALQHSKLYTDWNFADKHVETRIAFLYHAIFLISRTSSGERELMLFSFHALFLYFMFIYGIFAIFCYLTLFRLTTFFFFAATALFLGCCALLSFLLYHYTFSYKYNIHIL